MVYIEGFAADGGADNVDDGISCAYFMEVNFIYGAAVDMGFGFGDALENCEAVFFD